MGTEKLIEELESLKSIPDAYLYSHIVARIKEIARELDRKGVER